MDPEAPAWDSGTTLRGTLAVDAVGEKPRRRGRTGEPDPAGPVVAAAAGMAECRMACRDWGPVPSFLFCLMRRFAGVRKGRDRV